MYKLVSLNGRLLDAHDARIQAVSAAALYGRGVFTTVAVRNGEPFLWDKHWRRLCANASVLGIDMEDLSAEPVREAFDSLTAAAGSTDGRARMTLYDEGPSDMWKFEAPQAVSFLITVAGRQPKFGDARVTVSSLAVNSSSPLAGIKSCNYLDRLLAADAAKAGGFDEAVRLNERGEVVGGCMSNVFWTIGGELFTPSLSTGCLPGTTREFVLEQLPCIESPQGLDTLQSADAIYLTSAGLGVTRVREFNGRRLTGPAHAIEQLLQ